MECIASEESKLKQRHESSRSDEPPFVAKAVQGRLSKTELELLQAFVLRTAKPILTGVQDAIRDPSFQGLGAKDVAPPRIICEQLRAQLVDVVREMAAVLPPGGNLPASLVRFRLTIHGRVA
jgi:hypothetical protein